MNVWDCLPHKMAINRSLHKASDELRLKIDAYQVEYDRRVEKCKTELEQEEMKRNRELDKFKDSLNLELQDDQALLNEIYEDVTGYVDKYLYSKYIDKFLEAKKNLYKLLQEDCNFLFEQMKDISDEIEILRGRKQVLTSFTDVRDVIDLMTLSGYEIQTDSVVDAPALIKYINSTLANSEEKQETERYSLRRLKDIVQQRADYVSVIQYIDWVIEQKILFSKQLSAKRKTIRDTMSELNAETEKLVDEKRALKHDLVVLAERVRMHWARPITYLNAEIDYSYKRKNEEVKEKNEKIKKIKGEQREKRNIGDELHRRALFHEKKDKRQIQVSGLLAQNKGGAIMQIVYIPSESMSVQGKKDEIYKRYGKDWNIREQGGGNGNWLLTRKSDVLVDGKSYRTFVLEHYGKSKLTAKLVDKFREDVANGKIKL